MARTQAKIPEWLRRPITLQGQWDQSKQLVRDLKLNTVCEEANCPNLGECWSNGNVSFMILGDKCTRACDFCSVNTAKPGEVDAGEPERLAEAIAQLKIRYAVVTSVARDDLPDEGAGHFADCIRAIDQRTPSVQVEVLTPDFHAQPQLIQMVLEASPAVFSHNIETVERFSPEIRPQADYRRSLEVLATARRLAAPEIRIKSGIMVGFGEDPSEVHQTMRDLKSAGCDILTVGQYLQPTLRHHRVERFIPREQFELYRAWAEALEFSFVASGPYVRSSYNAYEAVQEEVKTV